MLSIPNIIGYQENCSFGGYETSQFPASHNILTWLLPVCFSKRQVHLLVGLYCCDLARYVLDRLCVLVLTYSVRDPNNVLLLRASRSELGALGELRIFLMSLSQLGILQSVITKYNTRRLLEDDNGKGSGRRTKIEIENDNGTSQDYSHLPNNSKNCHFV